MAVDALDWEATSHYLTESAEALPLQLQALRRCRLLRPVAPAIESRIRGHLGAIYTARHEWAEAIKSYEAALAAREGIRDMGRLARMYNDLTLAHLELGEAERALEYARKALAIHSLFRDEASLARVENNVALALMRQGVLDSRAEDHLARSLERCRRLGLETGRSHVLLSLGELHGRRGQFEQADVALAEALELAERLGERMTLASGYQLLGWLRQRRGDHAGVDAAFRRALEILSRLQVRERLAECHVQYAKALEARGDVASAVVHWKQAVKVVRARSL
jgi:tetratricopeptide (TPR) repeat protein